jgi:hypothetical protein
MQTKPYTDVSSGGGVTLNTGGGGGGADAWNCYVIDLLPTGDRTKNVHVCWFENDNISISKDATSKLQDWMTKVTAAASPARKMGTVQWVTSFPSGIKGDELYVYLAGSLDSSGKGGKSATATGSKFGGAATNAIRAGKGGQTQLQSAGVLCEIWPSTIDSGASPNKLALRVAQLIFHEWMHFKIDIDANAGDVVHKMKGGLGEVPIRDPSSENPPVDPGSPADPTDSDVSAVAGGLSKSYKFRSS